jgi:DNA-binding transcriptional regulator YiaG
MSFNSSEPNSPERASSRTSRSLPWTKDSIRSLRQRLGWSQAELSRRLQCDSADVDQWETGKSTPVAKFKNELQLLANQADACSKEVQSTPLVEKICDQKALGQIEFSEIKDEIE